jgi:hypothetical protein
MLLAVDSYRVTAKYYDAAYSAKQDLVDLPFYLNSRGSRRVPSSRLLVAPGASFCPSLARGSKCTAWTTRSLCLRF